MKTSVVVFGCIAGALAISSFIARPLLSREPHEMSPGLGSRSDYLQWPDGYSGDFQATDSQDPLKNCSGRLYVNTLASPRGVRRENVCGAKRRVFIWLQDGTTFEIDPDAKVYWKRRSEARLAMVTGDDRKHLERKLIDGRVIDVYEQTHNEGTSTVVEQVWEDTRLHAPVRIVTPTSSYQLTNVVEGPQSKALFTIPDGFTQIPSPE